tara:strand:- start:104 stop:604 length:501 start_codon:yes stop_codon:yes gene_type:complete
MKSHIWMPLFVSDYLADTTHLSTIEHGAYLLLIMDYWQHRGLSCDDKRLARICRMTDEGWNDIRDTLAELFDDGWIHHRIDDELVKADALREQKSNAGKASAIARGQQPFNERTNGRSTAVQQPFNERTNGGATEGVTARQRQGNQSQPPSHTPIRKKDPRHESKR